MKSNAPHLGSLCHCSIHHEVTLVYYIMYIPRRKSCYAENRNQNDGWPISQDTFVKGIVTQLTWRCSLNTMRLDVLCSGFNQRSPSFSNQHIFSQVTRTSPKAASRMGLPESRDETLQSCFLGSPKPSEMQGQRKHRLISSIITTDASRRLESARLVRARINMYCHC